MRILQVKAYLTDKELQAIMNKQKSLSSFIFYQIIYSVQTNFGKRAEDIAKGLCISTSKVYKTVERYNKLGLSWDKGVTRGGRRESRSIMSLNEEALFLKSIEQDALTGSIVTYKQIKSKLELKINRTVSDDYIWDLFKRHNWSKKVPRQSHPKSDKQAQEDYKEKFLNYWQPNHYSLVIRKITDQSKYFFRMRHVSEE
jgi:transposase